LIHSRWLYKLEVGRYIEKMNALTKKLLEEVETWPPEDQEELAEYAREIRGRRTGVYRLSDDERAGIERGLEDMRAGRFATDEEIAAIFRRARSSRA
jgi:predicted transcriptional regulator